MDDERENGGTTVPPEGNAPGGEDEAAAAEAAFVSGLEARGEVAPAGEDDLAPGVTHEVVEEDGDRRVRRRRFSAW